MALLKQIQQRYSVRSYQKRPVEKEKLETILQAARLAPSAKNMQEWRFIVVQDADTRRKLCVAANNQAFVGEAPVIIVCCSVISDYVMRCGHLAYPIDVAIAMEHMALQAVEEGLGTCWVGSFYEEQVKTILGIPTPVRVVELLTMGYPADTLRAKSRLPLEQIVCHERWKL
ncbi:MAG: nitroreductase family protein [Verrucomicrobia bacterium]|nr:nitroreductase family protein [Verrucomicrobiota bacterium]MBU1733786.1 nitroreductase family protein [Verrucomicrobiota bacterium]MBU1856735.1 nitroreductase family protein [Verrucomicrobiota bacterium]